MSKLLASVWPVCYDTRHMAFGGIPVLASSLATEDEPWTVEEIPDSIFVTIRNVPIASVGMDFQCASGSHTFTPEMIADLVASQEDPAIKPMRLKIGHDDPRFDGEPCLGKVVNMYVGDEGMTAYGDYAGVPAWLAEILPYAYPSRSIEGAMGVKTNTGKEWLLAAHSLALLGVTWPGCSVLDDLPTIFSKAGPEGVEVDVKLRAKKEVTIEASVSSEDIRVAYYEYLDNAGPEYYWWWVRAMYIVPAELIVEDGDGKLWRVGYSVNGDEVEFAEASRVEIEYVDVEARVAANMVVAGMSEARGSTNTAVVYASRAESRPEQEGVSMDLSVLCKTLGLPAGTPDAEVLAKAQEVAAAASESTEDGGEGAAGAGAAEGGDGSEGTEGGSEGGEEAAGEGAAAEPEVEASTATVDKETFQAMKDELAASRKEREDNQKAEDERFVDAAISAGKFAGSRRDHYVKLMNLDREGTKATIDSLESGAIPLHARATAPVLDADQIAAARSERESRFPELAARRAQRGQSRVTTEA